MHSTKEEITRCLDEEYDSITLLGDSHMRQLSKFLVAFKHGVPGVDRWKWGHLDTCVDGTIRYLWNMDAAALAGRICKDLVGGNHTARDLVVLNTAHWDLWSYPVTPFVRSGLPRVVEALEELRRDPATRHCRVVWITSFPMLPFYDGGFRSEPTSQAADAFLRPHLERLGVEILSVLPVIRPRSEVCTDDHHWFDVRAGRRVGGRYCRIER